jgi:Cupin-like domain
LYRPHIPISMPGVYSDVYYRQHSCRSFSLPAAWLSGDDATDAMPLGTVVPKVLVQDMTIERFVQEFETPNRPVLIQGAAKDWSAFDKWNADPSYCARHTAQQTFRATSGVAPEPAQFTWQSYFDYCGINSEGGCVRDSSRLLEEGPLYLFDRQALQPNSVLWKDYMYDLQRTCPYWDPERRVHVSNDTVGHDLFGLLGEGQRPDHTWLIVGPKRSGSVFHIDPNATHAWNAAICGRKRWIFYPPGVTPPGVHPSADGDQVALPLSIGEWLFGFWDEHVQRKTSATIAQRPMECTALPGDVLFVPHGWWHMVINLDDINIAITHNYVSTSNLSNVLKFLDTKRDQVSGCRDRADSIKPERLYQEFTAALQQYHPQWLQAALAVPDWTCRAWHSPATARRPLDRDKSTANECKSDTHAGTTSVMEKAKSSLVAGFSFSFGADQ